MKLFVAGLLGIATSIAFLADSKVIGGTLGAMAVALAIWGSLDKRIATSQRG